MNKNQDAALTVGKLQEILRKYDPELPILYPDDKNGERCEFLLEGHIQEVFFNRKKGTQIYIDDTHADWDMSMHEFQTLKKQSVRVIICNIR